MKHACHCCFLPVFFFALLTAGLVSGCTPRQKGAAAQGFYASGRGAFSVGVNPPFSLASTGTRSGKVPSDVSPGPQATFTYALFADTESGPVGRHIHAIFSELQRESWRWEMETWARPESLSYTKQRAGGKNWTVQILPVTGRTDWFNALWRINGRDAPEFWLAKRWSARPEDEVRVVLEYREPAPACMRERLADADAAARTDRNAPLLRGRELWRNCDEAIEAFSTRADAAVTLEGLGRFPETPLHMLTASPDFSPDMGKLVGRAEHMAFREHSPPN